MEKIQGRPSFSFVVTFAAVVILGPIVANAAVECTGTCKTWSTVYFDGVDAYSTEVERAEWLTALQADSDSPIQTDFGHLGQLMGFAGDVHLGTSDGNAILEWLHSHKLKLGLPQDVTLRLVGDAQPHFAFSGDEEILAGAQYKVEASLADVPFVGRGMSVLVRQEGDRIRGMFNGFVPATAGFVYSSCGVSESEAWGIAEQELGLAISALPSEPARLTWFE